MKKLYLKMFSVVLALSAIMFTISVSSSLFSVNAANTGFAMKDAQVYMGASVEDDMSGIKFTASLSESEFATITNGKEDPVYFGIAISANGVEREICYLVDSTSKATKVNKAVTFENGVCEYTATITYNEEILATELAEDERFNPNGLTVEEFKASEVFQKYLTAAYTTELTAQAFYRVGNDDSVQYVACGNAITYSMMGIASDFYVDVNGEDNGYLDGKYFDYVEDVNVSVIKETGVVEYDFVEGDIVYVDGKVIAVDNGALSVDFLADYDFDSVITLCVISADGKLNVVNATVESQNVIVSAQAFYDAAADKIYYEENGVQKTIQGVKGASFNYVADASNSYALADYSGETMVSNVNYIYADSVAFDTRTDGMSQSDTSFGYLMKGLQPKLKTASGTIVVNIPYNAHTDVYTGVTLSIVVAGQTWSFTDTVITSRMIDDAAELDSIFNQPDGNRVNEYLCVLRSASIIEYGTITKGVYMLANDIDCSTGFTFDNSYWNYFEGVFDGRGHNIYNLDVSGTETNPGNGLFSATSLYSAIQNVGFINVTANYGSVFQGNQFDYAASLSTVRTYYMVHSDSANKWVGTDGPNGLGSIYYRKQLVNDSDTTTTIGELLKSDRRGASFKLGQGGYFANVYVKVNPETQRLMGVISRNMANSVNTVRAYNMVIEYLPTQLYDSAEGANDGALPYNYDYTQGLYGTVFGGAYTPNNATGSQYDKKTASHVAKNEDGTYKLITFFTPNSDAPNGQSIHTQGALIFNHLTQHYAGRVNFATKVYVISTVGLVSSAQGKILGTNQEVDANNPYKFVTEKSYYYNPNTHGVVSKLESYASYEDAAKSGYNTNNLLTSFYLDNGAELNYWDISNGYLAWKNV